jgi:hypothetical protein
MPPRALAEHTGGPSVSALTTWSIRIANHESTICRTMQLSRTQSHVLLHICQNSLMMTQFKVHRSCNLSAPLRHLHPSEK